MALIDKETIHAEIDKLYGEYKDKFHQSGDQYHLGLIDGLDMAERVLDTLPEQPVEGLDVTDFCKPIDPGIAQCVADHWWEMIGEESTNKKSVEGLEEEIERFYRTDEYRIADTLGRGFETLARHFAEWQYQKDRVEFAKLKAREWINGYDEGYAKGLDARKEDK